MSAFAAKVEAAYAASVAREIRVPEWELTLHIRPLTIAQLARIQSEDDMAKRAVRVIQVRGRDSQGRAVLDEADFIALCTNGVGPYSPEIIGRVAREIMDDMPDAETAEKN